VRSYVDSLQGKLQLHYLPGYADLALVSRTSEFW